MRLCDHPDCGYCHRVRWFRSLLFFVPLIALYIAFLATLAHAQTATFTPTVTPTLYPANYCCHKDVPNACGPPQLGVNCGSDTPVANAACDGGTGNCVTLTPTPTVPTPTNTPTATNTATNTATPTQPGGCCGDINLDRNVFVNELTACVNTMGLHCGDPGFIPACDCNYDCSITASDIDTIVNNLGNDCPVPTFTPSLTATATVTPTATATSACGNGSVDAGEDCDNGAGFNGIFGQCCTANCHFMNALQVCRVSLNVCDLTEYCTGSSGTCPTDLHVGDGAVCGADACQTCSGGVCGPACTKTPTATSTKTPTPTKTATPRCCGDTNGDGFISGAEYAACSLAVLNNQCPSSCDCVAAFGVCDINDLVFLGPRANTYCAGVPTFTATFTITKTPTVTPTRTSTPTAPSPTATGTICNNDLHTTLPVSNAAFLSNTQQYMCHEDADRYVEAFHSFAYIGGYHGTQSGRSVAPGSPMIAYVNGSYVTESGVVTYPDASYCWLIASDVKAGDIAPFTRVPGTHYLLSCGTDPVFKPQIPSTTLLLEYVITTAGSISGVQDLRSRVPWSQTVQHESELPATNPRVNDFTYVLDTNKIYVYTDAWHALKTE